MKKLRLAVGLALAVVATTPVQAYDVSGVASTPLQDKRIRMLLYSPDQIIRVRGWVGYHIDVEFEPGESFVSLGGGDLEGLTVGSYANHLVLKPRAPSVRTNLTVFTSRRTYWLDYAVSPRVPDLWSDDLIYTLRFVYPKTANPAVLITRALETAAAQRTQNRDYWYCGASDLRPIVAYDDGNHTHLTFAPQSEVPAIFVRSDDGRESLLNFTSADGEIIIHRIARRLILRRGPTTGCVVNKGFTGTGERLDSGTVSPSVSRRRVQP